MCCIGMRRWPQSNDFTAYATMTSLCHIFYCQREEKELKIHYNLDRATVAVHCLKRFPSFTCDIRRTRARICRKSYIRTLELQILPQSIWLVALWYLAFLSFICLWGKSYLSTDFSAMTVRTKRQWNNSFKVPRENSDKKKISKYSMTILMS